MPDKFYKEIDDIRAALRGLMEDVDYLPIDNDASKLIKDILAECERPLRNIRGIIKSSMVNCKMSDAEFLK